MANISIQKKHRQFALIIIAIVVIVGIAFSAWYFSDKKNTQSVQKNNVPITAERDNYNPANITAAD